MGIVEDIKSYVPFNEQEAKDKEYILAFINNNTNAFYRDNVVAHMTASAWVTNKDHTKILMAYHNIYHSFSWLGGHCDGEEDCLKVAIKEVKEEAGINNVKPISKDIFSLEVLTVDGHVKKGKYVSSHLHLNVTYLLEADEDELLSIKEDENSAVKWFEKEAAVLSSNEEWFKENIYTKLNKKMGEYYENN